MELPAGKAHPGDPLRILQEAAICQRSHVLYEPHCMKMVSFSDALQGSCRPKAAFRSGGADVVRIAFVPGVMLSRCGSAEKLDGGGRRRLLISGGRKGSALGRQQAVQYGGMLFFLSGGEAEGVGNNQKALCLQTAGCLLIKAAKTAFLSHRLQKAAAYRAFFAGNDRRGGPEG